MKKLFAVLAASTLLVPAIASADALEDATRRGVCGENVTPLSAEYTDIDGVRHLKVSCPVTDACTLCGTGLGGGTGAALAGLVIVAAAAGGDDTSTTTTTTTTTTGN